MFEEGSLGSQLYIVYLGHLKAVARMVDDGQDTATDVVLNEFKEGDFFGEISLVMGMPRTASIVGNPSLRNL